MQDGLSENQIFIGYDTAELKVLKRYLNPVAAPIERFHIDGFGNKTRLDFFFSGAIGGAIQADVPFPDNGQYAEAIEYLGTMRAVQAATDMLVVYELGAGFAPWLVAAKTFARKHPSISKIKLVAVEADPSRIPLIRTNFQDNEIPLPGEFHGKIQTEIINAGVSDRKSELNFFAQSLHDWGGTVREDGENEYRGMEDRGKVVSIPTFPIKDLLSDENRVDLLHIDIQGWEFRSISASIQDLNAKVATMVIGTHSRVIEGEIIDLLRKNNWLLIYEKPCKFHSASRLPDLVGATYFDGTQVWINDGLWPTEFNWE